MSKKTNPNSKNKVPPKPSESVRYCDPSNTPTNSVEQLSSSGESRRDFIGNSSKAVMVATAASAFGVTKKSNAQSSKAATTVINFTVNGTNHSLQVQDRWTLSEILRDQLNLTGTKIGCNRSECGACTVLLNGTPVYSCSQLAVWADNSEVLTVEGLAHNGELSPVQQAFVENNGSQCGFCTPGQLMTATALLNSNPTPSSDEVRAAMVGNLCRCSNYNAIVDAVVAAGKQGGAA